MCSYTDPTVAEFKIYFERDFPYGTDIEDSVTDADIQKALDKAGFNINCECFPSQEEYTVGYNLLAAHYLVMSLRASSQGISGQFKWLQSSHSAGSVSESMAIPESITSNPMYAYFTKTNYGAEYLMMIYTCLIGAVYTVEGATHP